MVLWIRGQDPQDPGSLANCQGSRLALRASKARHTLTIACGSAEFFDHTGFLVTDKKIIQAVLSKEASTASGTSMRTNQSFGYK